MNNAPHSDNLTPEDDAQLRRMARLLLTTLSDAIGDELPRGPLEDDQTGDE